MVDADANRLKPRAAPSTATEANSSGVVGTMGAISPKSGSLWLELPEQWHALGLPFAERCIAQHFAAQADDSQTMPRARKASGVSRSARITAEIWIRRIVDTLPHANRPNHSRRAVAAVAVRVCVHENFAVGSETVLPFKLIYDERYDLNLGAHVFPSQKYRMVRDRLLEEKVAAAEDFLPPAPATDEDILRAHSQEYVYKLKTGSLSHEEILRMEVPYSKKLVEACWLAAGGSILAGRRAMEDGYAVNIGGGFHHACPDHGEGFCVIHDVAVAIRHLQFHGAIGRAMVVDTDVHQGNGTAVIFGGDGDVFTFSIHQENNYPYPKPPSTVDVNLPNGTGDEDYLAILEKHLHQAFHDFAPEIVFYVAGADPYREDQLGGLALTIEGLKRRDAVVFDYARRNGAPVAVTFGGGYARRVADTVTIHVNTILATRDAANRPQGRATIKAS